MAEYYTGKLTPSSGSSGDYDDLTNKPTIPAPQVNSDWNANSGVTQILNKPSFATVATSGSYLDLTNTPDIPTVTSSFNPQGTDAVNGIAVASAVSAISNTIAGGTQYQGKFSELPAFISGLAGKLSNGVITYKITEDETLNDSIAIILPLWNIPEVIIDGNEKNITINSSNPYIPTVAIVPQDYTMSQLITNFNSNYQVLRFKNFNFNFNHSVMKNGIYNSADINLKIDACNISCIATCVNSTDGLLEVSFCEFSPTQTEDWSCGLRISELCKCKSFSNTFTNIRDAVYVTEGGQIQCISDVYDNCDHAVSSTRSAIGTLYTAGSVTNSLVAIDQNKPVNSLGGISYN